MDSCSFDFEQLKIAIHTLTMDSVRKITLTTFMVRIGY